MDLDGRYAKMMISVSMSEIGQCIQSALEKHARLEVVNLIGNYDEMGALWMSAALRHAYENDRVCPATMRHLRSSQRSMPMLRLADIVLVKT